MVKKMFFIFCLCFLIQQNVFASEYIADGTGPTEKAAIQDSFRNALENVVGAAIDSRTYSKNYKIIRDQIYSHTEGYIRSYEVLKRSSDGSVYSVRTKVVIDTVADSSLMNALDKIRAIKIGMNDPRIGILIINNDNYKKLSDASAESAITSNLNNAGFSHIININQLNQIKKEQFQNAAFNGDYNTIAMLGTQENLDYIITGSIASDSIDTRFDTRQVPMLSSRSTLNVSTTKCDTGEIVQSGHYQESGADVTQDSAAENAKYNTAKKAGNDISNKLINYATTTSKNFTIYAHNIKDQTNLQMFESYLTHVWGIQDVYIRTFSNNTAVVDISFNGDGQTLATYLNQDEECPANITKITNSTIDLILK